jgi:hypothetical protein
MVTIVLAAPVPESLGSSSCDISVVSQWAAKDDFSETVEAMRYKREMRLGQ